MSKRVIVLPDRTRLTADQVVAILVPRYYNDMIFIALENGYEFCYEVPPEITKEELADQIAALIWPEEVVA